MDRNTVMIPVMLIGLLALLPGWWLCQTAFYVSRRKIGVVLLALLLPPALAAPFFYLPFLLSKEKTVGPFQTFSDLLLFGVFPLGVVALTAYVADHFADADRPTKPLVAGTACIAMAALPVLFYFFADQMHAALSIKFEE